MSKNNNFISIDNAKIENDIKKRYLKYNLEKKIKPNISFFEKDINEILIKLKNKNLTDRDIEEIFKEIKEIKRKDDKLNNGASKYMRLSEENKFVDLVGKFRDVENEKQFEELKTEYKREYEKKYKKEKSISKSSTNSDVSDITTISMGGNPKKSKKRRRTQKKNKTIFRKK
jgi:hypothetical protein